MQASVCLPSSSFKDCALIDEPVDDCYLLLTDVHHSVTDQSDPKPDGSAGSALHVS